LRQRELNNRQSLDASEVGCARCLKSLYTGDFAGPLTDRTASEPIASALQQHQAGRH
jgi:hypothetical protein